MAFFHFFKRGVRRNGGPAGSVRLISNVPYLVCALRRPARFCTVQDNGRSLNAPALTASCITRKNDRELHEVQHMPIGFECHVTLDSLPLLEFTIRGLLECSELLYRFTRKKYQLFYSYCSNVTERLKFR